MGRKWLIIGGVLISVGLLVLLPYTAPYFWLLIVVRSLLSIMTRLVHVNPLIIDYFKNQSLGLAYSLMQASAVTGQLLMITVFSSTRALTLLQQYWVPALFFCVLIVVLIFFLSEPALELEKGEGNQESSQPKSPLWSRLKIIVSEVWRESKEQPKYIFTFINMMACRLFVTLFSVYLQMWVLSFEKSGVLESKQ